MRLSTPPPEVIRVLPGGSDPENFDISADGTHLFVSNGDRGLASVLDIASGKSPRPFQSEGNLKVCGSAGREAVWLTPQPDDNVTIIDASTGKRLGAVQVGKRRRGIAFTPMDGVRNL